MIRSKVEKPNDMQLEMLRLGLALVGIGIEDKKVLAKIWITMKYIQKKGGDFNIRDAVDIEIAVDKKWKPKIVKAKSNDTPKSKDSGGSDSTTSPAPVPGTAV